MSDLDFEAVEQLMEKTVESPRPASPVRRGAPTSARRSSLSPAPEHNGNSSAKKYLGNANDRESSRGRRDSPRSRRDTQRSHGNLNYNRREFKRPDFRSRVMPDDYSRRGGGSRPSWGSRDRRDRGDRYPSGSGRVRSHSRDRGDRVDRVDYRRRSPGHEKLGGGDTGGAARPQTTAAPFIRREKEEEMRKKEVEEARRDDLTVLVLNLSLKAEERHIYEFFSANAGKIRDIQLIKDQRSGTSKGVAYTEFYTQEAVIKAMALNGINFKGQPLRVQASMAEKNRAAKAAKQVHPGGSDLGIAIPMRVYVGGLTGKLASISEEELLSLFTPFGSITECVMPQDPLAGESVGFAFLMFASAADAHDAMQHLHNYQIADSVLRVGYAADGVRGSNTEVSPPLQTGQVSMSNMGVCSGSMGMPGNSIAMAAAAAAAVAASGGVAPTVSQEAKLAQQLAASIRMQQQNTSGATQEIQQGSEAYEDEQKYQDDIDDDDEGYIQDPSRKKALMQKLLNRADSSLQDNDLAPQRMAHAPPPDQVFLKSSNGLQGASLGLGVITSYLSLSNLFSPEEANSVGSEYFEEIKDDVRQECGKYGQVLDVRVNPSLSDGKVWVQFSSPSSAQAANEGLHGRFFAGKQIVVEYVTEAMMKKECAQ